jgi:hypothetical protein
MITTINEFKRLNENQEQKPSIKTNEGITAGDFEDGFVRAMEKFLPKDRWTVAHDKSEILITNDFGETAVYRMARYTDSKGTFNF